MDYISFPEKLIYCERERLEDFDVKNKKTLNYILEAELHKLYYTKPGYKQFALNILNTAYYICTMVKADDDPTRNFGDYLNIIEKRMQGCGDDVALVLSMVLIIIDAYKWNEIKTDLGTFALQVFYEIEKHKNIRYAYYEQAKNNYEWRADHTILSYNNEFKRRPIDYRLLADTYSVDDLRNLFGTNLNEVLEFINTLGKDEDEQYLICSFLEDQMYSFFPDAWRRKAFFDYIKSDIHKYFHGEEENAQIMAQIDEDLMKESEQQWQLDYYKDEYQKQKAEIENLHAEIEILKGKLKELDDRTSITKEQLEEIFPTEESNTVNDINQIIKSDNQTADKDLQQQLADAHKTIEEQQQTIESLKNDLEAFKTRDKKGKDIPLFTAKQIAIFMKAILFEHRSLTNNVKNLAPLLQRFGGGFAPSTAENALGYEVTQEECDVMEYIFYDYAPAIGSIIKGYPQKFKKIKDKKLLNNLKQ